MHEPIAASPSSSRTPPFVCHCTRCGRQVCADHGPCFARRKRGPPRLSTTCGIVAQVATRPAQKGHNCPDIPLLSALATASQSGPNIFSNLPIQTTTTTIVTWTLKRTGRRRPATHSSMDTSWTTIPMAGPRTSTSRWGLVGIALATRCRYRLRSVWSNPRKNEGSR